MRPLCKCGRRPAAVNYKKQGKTYYRKLCGACLHKGAREGIPKWQQAKYEKKEYCEKCGFKSRFPEQFDVYHIDGNLNSCRPNNLKTVCANCQRVLYKTGVRWRQGDLTPDHCSGQVAISRRQ